jgi:small multidrug resistance pump
MYLYWLLLGAAILCEVAATTTMKLSTGLTKFLPSIMLMVGYTASGILITFAIKRIELPIAYTIWAGLGVFLTTDIGIYFFKENLTRLKGISAAMTIAGVTGLYISQPSKTLGFIT